MHAISGTVDAKKMAHIVTDRWFQLQATCQYVASLLRAVQLDFQSDRNDTRARIGSGHERQGRKRGGLSVIARRIGKEHVRVTKREEACTCASVSKSDAKDQLIRPESAAARAYQAKAIKTRNPAAMRYRYIMCPSGHRHWP